MEVEDLEIKGSPQKAILKMLDSRLEEDFTYNSGRIIGSMCTHPHPLAKKVYARFLEKNLGDAGLFPATAELEKETIQMLGTLLSNPNASGHIVTGGTEGNVLALWTAKKVSRKTHCEVIVPASAHRSFYKAADLSGIKIVEAKLDRKHQVDVADVKKLVNSYTIAVVGIAGTTELGAIDPIAELSELATQEELYLHVDAAFGGLVIPFLKDLGFDVPDFDFALPGVCSITVDPHKMGFAPIPAGGILFRNENLRKVAAWDTPYLAGGETEQATIVGTRSGASVIAAWAVMKHLGRQGYRKIVKKCMGLTLRLAEEIPHIEGIDIVTKPTMNIVGLKSDRFDIRRVAHELRRRAWAVSLFPNHIRIVLMPHVLEEHLEKFLEDLSEVANQLRG
jgi:tyrosine decarboxylase/aspartate 1-decarboxylase